MSVAHSTRPLGAESTSAFSGALASEKGIGVVQTAEGSKVLISNEVSEIQRQEQQRLKQKYKKDLRALQELFEWTEDDLLAVLQESNFDVQIAANRISEGFAKQWSQVRPSKPKKEQSKPVKEAMSSSTSSHGSKTSIKENQEPRSSGKKGERPKRGDRPARTPKTDGQPATLNERAKGPRSNRAPSNVPHRQGAHQDRRQQSTTPKTPSADVAVSSATQDVVKAPSAQSPPAVSSDVPPQVAPQTTSVQKTGMSWSKVVKSDMVDKPATTAHTPSKPAPPSGQTAQPQPQKIALPTTKGPVSLSARPSVAPQQAAGVDSNIVVSLPTVPSAQRGQLPDGPSKLCVPESKNLESTRKNIPDVPVLLPAITSLSNLELQFGSLGFGGLGTSAAVIEPSSASIGTKKETEKIAAATTIGLPSSASIQQAGAPAPTQAAMKTEVTGTQSSRSYGGYGVGQYAPQLPLSSHYPGYGGQLHDIPSFHGAVRSGQTTTGSVGIGSEYGVAATVGSGVPTYGAGQYMPAQQHPGTGFNTLASIPQYGTVYDGSDSSALHGRINAMGYYDLPYQQAPAAYQSVRGDKFAEVSQANSAGQLGGSQATSSISGQSAQQQSPAQIATQAQAQSQHYGAAAAAMQYAAYYPYYMPSVGQFPSYQSSYGQPFMNKNMYQMYPQSTHSHSHSHAHAHSPHSHGHGSASTTSNGAATSGHKGTGSHQTSGGSTYGSYSGSQLHHSYGHPGSSNPPGITGYDDMNPLGHDYKPSVYGSNFPQQSFPSFISQPSAKSVGASTTQATAAGVTAGAAAASASSDLGATTYRSTGFDKGSNIGSGQGQQTAPGASAFYNQLQPPGAFQNFMAQQQQQPQSHHMMVSQQNQPQSMQQGQGQQQTYQSQHAQRSYWQS